MVLAAVLCLAGAAGAWLGAHRLAVLAAVCHQVICPAVALGHPEAVAAGAECSAGVQPAGPALLARTPHAGSLAAATLAASVQVVAAIAAVVLVAVVASAVEVLVAAAADLVAVALGGGSLHKRPAFSPYVQ